MDSCVKEMLDAYTVKEMKMEMAAMASAHGNHCSEIRNRNEKANAYSDKVAKWKRHNRITNAITGLIGASLVLGYAFMFIDAFGLWYVFGL